MKKGTTLDYDVRASATSKEPIGLPITLTIEPDALDQYNCQSCCEIL